MIAFDGPVWRLVQSPLIETVTQPAAAPEGRFHYAGQVAIYASLSAEGAGVAIKRYLGDNLQRYLAQCHVMANEICDHRGNQALCVVWQDARALGDVAPTWAYSDAARAAGARGMLYSSRSRPDLDHIVLFDRSCIKVIGEPVAWSSTRAP